MPKISRRRFLQAATILPLAGCSGLQPATPTARVVVIGGGYGGASVSKYLRRLNPGLEVTLVEPAPLFYSCPGSNAVIAGLESIEQLQCRYDALSRHHGVRVIHQSATAIDAASRRVQLDNGERLAYDRLILAPGIDFRWDALAGYDQSHSEQIPHAWKAGPQTLLLQRQLQAMDDGGVVIITVPPAPFRCPPGPYERASLIAHYLKRHKPKAKILILDGNAKFPKQALFMQGWQALYPGLIEWLPYTEEGSIERIDSPTRTVITEFGRHRAAVLNHIPPQQAGLIARRAGLTDASGWCPVQLPSFESRLQPGIHVIGDACRAAPMPKSAFAANSQAKTCAAAVVALLDGGEPGPASLINTCYSLLAPDYAISIAAVYRSEGAELVTTASGITPADADRSREARYAHGWYRNIRADAFE